MPAAAAGAAQACADSAPLNHHHVEPLARFASAGAAVPVGRPIGVVLPATRAAGPAASTGRAGGRWSHLQPARWWVVLAVLRSITTRSSCWPGWPAWVTRWRSAARSAMAPPAARAVGPGVAPGRAGGRCHTRAGPGRADASGCGRRGTGLCRQCPAQSPPGRAADPARQRGRRGGGGPPCRHWHRQWSALFGLGAAPGRAGGQRHTRAAADSCGGHGTGLCWRCRARSPPGRAAGQPASATGGGAATDPSCWPWCCSWPV
jgi:hypothetical protein